MAFTIGQIQSKIDSQSLDARQLINLIADYLQANPGGGSGMVLESYQNSAMSAAVMAYVFRDVDDNIYRVYEPIRNNDVSRSTFSYAESIDLVPFDNTNWYDNRFLDLKLISVASDAIIQSSILQTMVINGGNKADFIIEGLIQKGEYGGDAPHNAEIYITGDRVHIFDSEVGCATFFDSMGDDCVIDKVRFGTYCDINFNNYTNCRIARSDLLASSEIDFNANTGIFNNSLLLANAYINFQANATVQGAQICNLASLLVTLDVTNTYIGVNSNVDTALGSITVSTIGNNVNYNPASPQSGVNIQNIAGTTYELGVSAGNVTAT